MYNIKVLHVARRFISTDLNELKIGYDLKHFKAMSELMKQNSVIFQSKNKKEHEIKDRTLTIYLVPNLFDLFFSTIKYGRSHDLIVAQNPFVAGLICVVAGLIIKKPVLVSVHGYEFTVGKIQSSMKKFVCSKATLIRANSKVVKKTIISWGIKPEKIFVIEDRVDCEHFSNKIDGDEVRKKLGIVDKMVISVGSLIEIKGFDTLIDAAKIVTDVIKTTRFVIAGEGSLKDQLQQRCKQLGISDKVLFVGNIPYDQLPKYYAASDLFVHPSNVESMGRVILEAQASGKPVIATNVGGIPEAVSEKSAILVSPKEPETLARNIIQVLSNEKLALDLAENGRAFVLENFEFWKQEEKLIKFYNHIIKEH